MNVRSFLLAILLLCGAVSSAHAGFLQFPINGYTSSTAPVTAVMDHQYNTPGVIETYTGEVGSSVNGCMAYVGGQNVPCNSTNTTAPRGYKRPYGLTWSTPGLNYNDYVCEGYPNPNCEKYMWYDNHRGYDYAVERWTPVVASANGTVVAEDFSYGQITIDHGNGYRTVYTHMYMPWCFYTVTKGQVVGYVSNVSPTLVGVHLHFVVQKLISGTWQPVDPYGGVGQPVLWE